MPGYDTHGDARTISALRELTIGAQKNTLKRRDELSYDSLNEYDQQIQVAISGTAGDIASYVLVQVFFDVYFLAGTLQRANNLIWPHFTYGSVLHTAKPILIWANVMSWILDGVGETGNNTVVGANIQWGSMAPDFVSGAPIIFTGALHLNFQGMGAPHDVAVDAVEESPLTPSSNPPPLPPPSPPPTGAVLFDGTRYASWPLDESAVRGGGAGSRVQEVADPGGGSDTVLRFTTLNTDTNSPLGGTLATPNSDPRSQLSSPTVYVAGQEYWTSYQLWIPNGSPLANATAWTQQGEVLFGAPFNGGPPFAIGVSYIANYGTLTNGAYLSWRDDDLNAYLWTTPVANVLGRWMRITWNFVVATSGKVTLYVNNTQVANISSGALDSADNVGPWFANLNLYYQHNEFTTATVYYKNFKIATTQAAAEGL